MTVMRRVCLFAALGSLMGGCAGTAARLNALPESAAAAAAPWPRLADTPPYVNDAQTYRDRAIQGSGKKNPTVREFINVTKRGQLRDPWIGTGKQVADIFEEWFHAPACDGFVITGTYSNRVYLSPILLNLRRYRWISVNFTGWSLKNRNF